MIAKLTPLWAVIMVGFTAGSASAVLLDFEGLGLAHNDEIPQSYGDSPGVDVSHTVLTSFGNTTPLSPFALTFWTTGYGDLTNVAWGEPSSSSNVGQISFDANAGQQVTLNSFDLAGWAGDRADRSVRIYNQDYSSILWSSGPETIDGTGGHNDYSPGITGLSGGTIHLQWDYPWGVAIDNVDYSYESTNRVADTGATLALLGFAMSGLVMLRRRFGAK